MNRISFNSNSVDDNTGDDISFYMNVSPGNESVMRHHLERVICRAKETLKALEAKQKTWDQKVESQEVQPEQESSTPNNDQKSQEKEQSQRTVRTNKQYIVSYPDGETQCKDTGSIARNCDIADLMIDNLRKGYDIAMPNTWKVQVIDL